MIRSPGTKRYCPDPIPEEVLLKLGLLGLHLHWSILGSSFGSAGSSFGWRIFREDGTEFSNLIIPRDPPWDEWMTWLADSVASQRYPHSWTKPEHVDTMAVDHASVIAEENFDA
jgi:hypothetical protein